jgi:hypothetical protein
MPAGADGHIVILRRTPIDSIEVDEIASALSRGDPCTQC